MSTPSGYEPPPGPPSGPPRYGGYPGAGQPPSPYQPPGPSQRPPGPPGPPPFGGYPPYQPPGAVRRKSRKPWFIGGGAVVVVAVVVVVLFFTVFNDGGSKVDTSSPQGAIRSWLQAAKNNDDPTMKKLTCSADQHQFKNGSFGGVNDTMVDFKVGSVKQTGDIAIVMAEVTIKPVLGDQHYYPHAPYPAKKFQGRWLFCPSAALNSLPRSTG